MAEESVGQEQPKFESILKQRRLDRFIRRKNNVVRDVNDGYLRLNGLKRDPATRTDKSATRQLTMSQKNFCIRALRTVTT